jgi:hypothetical protein
VASLNLGLSFVHYFQSLVASALPFPPWALAVLWLLLYTLNYRLALSVVAATSKQVTIVPENSERLPSLSESLGKRRLLDPIAFFITVFGVTLWSGIYPLFVFWAGGSLVALIFILGMNVQSLLGARALLVPNDVSGHLTVSAYYSSKQHLQRVGTLTALCAAMGLLTAHLALIGGAALLCRTALGVRRKMNRLLKNQSKI